MTETDKKIAACVDQIKHDIDRLAELAEGEDFDVDVLEDHIIEITDRLTLCKQRLTIEHGGLTLTKYPPKLPAGGIRPVICIETGKVYDSISQAAQDTGINGGNISLVVRGINRTAGGYHWEAFEDVENLTGIARRSRLQKVVCIETGEVFESVAEAGRAMGINPHNISNAVNGKCNTSGGFHWCKYKDYPKEEANEKAKNQEQRTISLELIEWSKEEK